MKKKNRICFIFNYPPHYRLPIYSKVDELLDTDFYFGDKVTTAIKPFDVTLLKGFKANLTTVRFMKILTRYKGLSAVFKGDISRLLLQVILPIFHRGLFRCIVVLLIRSVICGHMVLWLILSLGLSERYKSYIILCHRGALFTVNMLLKI